MTQLNLHVKECFYASVAHAVLKALCDMKHMKMMHRDVKPGNILLDNDGNIKLCDYGIVGFANNSSKCNSFKGDAIYMAVIFTYKHALFI
jgi:mitogen-activated protein kinase kinase